ncbi:hypothetical protein [Pseudosulfitobacter sp. DSM 107133]|jgi:hypothetical protein|nr:hypothetical protein [Pseudosulfitobacter sp. DSM 107133]UOA27471.1 hypothetical protein DSM107133_02197 [Pseudosulfitobacter sp. DSM 107133]
MQTLQNGYKGLSLLVLLNGDRALYLVTIAAALWVGAYFAG